MVTSSRLATIHVFPLLLVFLHYFNFTLFPFRNLVSFHSSLTQSLYYHNFFATASVLAFSHLLCYFLIILFQFIAHLFRAYNIACFVLYFCKFAFFTLILLCSLAHFHRAGSIRCFLFLLMYSCRFHGYLTFFCNVV